MKEFNFETLKKLIKLVEKRIRSINESIASSDEQIEKVDEFDELIKKINSDSLFFSDNKIINKVMTLLEGIDLGEKEELLTKLIDNLDYLNFVASSIQEDKFTSFNDDELVMINEVVEILKEFKELSHNQKFAIKSQYTKRNEELNKLYDKLRKGSEGVVHFTPAEINYLLYLIDENDLKFKYECLELIRILSKYIHENIINQLIVDDFGVIEEEYEIDEEEIPQQAIPEDVIVSTFAKYGFDFNLFSSKHQMILRTKRGLNYIEEVLEVLSTCDEYKFLRDININSKNYEKKLLFFVVRYATKETLIHLIESSRDRDVTVEKIFRVGGVYKRVSKSGNSEVIIDPPTPEPPSVNDESLNGCHEYYMKNSKLFAALSSEFKEKYDIEIDFFKSILNHSPEVLALPSDLVVKNLTYMKEYDIPFISNKNDVIKPNAPTILESRHFVKLVDQLIEADLYDYIKEYPSIIKNENLVKAVLYEQFNGTLERDGMGRILYVREHLKEYIARMDDIEKVVNHDSVNRLNVNINLPKEFFEMLDRIENLKEPYNTMEPVIMRLDNNTDIYVVGSNFYTINGVIVSRNKVLRVWSAIVKCGLLNDYSETELLLYALTYNSYYNDEQTKILSDFVQQPNFGGGHDRWIR